MSATKIKHNISVLKFPVSLEVFRWIKNPAERGLWCKESKIDLMFIQPGKPTQNGFIERCNGNIRRELLNAYVFKSINEVREKAEEYMLDYNNNRPHSDLNFKTPIEFLENV